MNDCLFCKIIAGEIPSKKVYEDELCYAFYDIAPLAQDAFPGDPEAAPRLPQRRSRRRMRRSSGTFTPSSRSSPRRWALPMASVLSTNCGQLAGQTVHHLHFHVLSGQQLGSFN